jgi:3-dehydroshikimate dehydratase
MVKISAFADEVSYFFEEQLKFLNMHDIKYIELRGVNARNLMNLPPKDLNLAKKLLNDYSIKVSAIASPIGKIEINKDFKKHFSLFKHAVEVANFFETPLLRVFSYYAPKGESINDYRQEVMDRMMLKAEFLKGSNIMMVLENDSNTYGESAEKCVDIIETVNSENLKLTYDPGNFVWGLKIKNNIEKCWPLMKSNVAHIHLKDWMVGSNKTGSIPGDGDGQISELISELAKINYSGFITIEPHLKSGGQFGGQTSPEQFTLAINRVKDMCKKTGLVYS